MVTLGGGKRKEKGGRREGGGGRRGEEEGGEGKEKEREGEKRDGGLPSPLHEGMYHTVWYKLSNGAKTVFHKDTKILLLPLLLLHQTIARV